MNGKKFTKLFILVVILIFMIVGCTQQQESKVKGVKDKGQLEEEPTIRVKLAEGELKEMKAEEYIQGVIAGEMKKDWPENAYGAQAIKARTFLLREIEDTSDNIISARHEETQAYKPENITPAIKTAVEKTKGEVVTYKGEYIKAWFHSSAGGETTSAKVGLNYKKAEPEYIKSVESPDEAAPADIKNWELALSEEDIIGVLEESGETANQVENIEIVDKDQTGRIVELDIIHDQGTKKMPGADFRMAVGPDKLKSTKVESINKEGNSFKFKGAGYGHGVGMSQWGSYKLAEEGESPEDIIAYYFDDVKVEKIY
ncbi:MAG: SpoIID/LytB domain-containing protein [Bacillota bacterium]